MPIARQSRESLAGRIKDRRLLPFSFREFCLFSLREREDAGFRDVLEAYPLLRRDLIAGRAAEARDLLLRMDTDLLRFREKLNRCTQEYFRDGGFPEVWGIADAARKQEYLWDSFIKRVLFEDLAERRKPESIARLCSYLLANPGLELNTARIAREAAVTRQIAEAYLGDLRDADLVQRVPKFRSTPFRVREGNAKYYVLDLALQHAVARTWDAVAQDDNLFGRCAENLVATHLASWSEKLELAYYRDDQREVDFVVTCERNTRLPIEVKHRREMEGPRALEWFLRKHGAPLGVVVTREQTTDLRDKIITIPLRYFLLAT
jgi:predicted AAA+ superfamily ATPase